jgi:hypothetical protein
VVECPQQRFGQQPEIAKGISPRGLTKHCNEKAGYINSSRCTSAVSLFSFCGSIAALALASFNEHVTEANVSRLRPPKPSVLCTVPKAQSSRGWKNNLTFPFGKHARAPPALAYFTYQTATRSFLHFSTPSRPFHPACSPPLSCSFARNCSPADEPVRLSDGHQVLRGFVRRARHWRQRRELQVRTTRGVLRPKARRDRRCARVFARLSPPPGKPRRQNRAE